MSCCTILSFLSLPWTTLVLTLSAIYLFFLLNEWLTYFCSFLLMQTSYNVIAYRDKPRLQTALELLKTTQEIEHELEKVCKFWFFRKSFEISYDSPIFGFEYSKLCLPPKPLFLGCRIWGVPSSLFLLTLGNGALVIQHFKGMSSFWELITTWTLLVRSLICQHSRKLE